MRILVVISTVLCLCATFPLLDTTGTDDPKPLDMICGRKLECPAAADNSPEGADYGIRTVYSANWVGTALEDINDMKTSTRKSFWKLFSYINGNNTEKQLIDMTIPVVYVWAINQTDSSLMGGRMFFYLPKKFQDNPPIPNDSLVMVKKFPEMDLYYRAFGGNDRSAAKYRKEFKALKTYVDAAGYNMDFHYAFTAGYTRPQWGQQRQEVMFADKATPFIW